MFFLTRGKECCGEIAKHANDEAATLRSMHTGDAFIGVTRLSSATSERLGGTWYMALDGEASTRIDVGAPAEEVSRVIANLSAAGNVSVTDNADGLGFNGERSWVLKFHEWNDPSRTAKVPTVTLGSEDLRGTGAAAYMNTAGMPTIPSGDELQLSQMCVKAAVKVTSLLSSGTIDDCVFESAWQGGVSYVVPGFSFDANSSTVEAALTNIDESVLGEVWVSTSSSRNGEWNITFIGNAKGRIPELECGSDAVVSSVANATCDAIGGTFVLEYEGNTTKTVAYNASALEVCITVNHRERYTSRAVRSSSIVFTQHKSRTPQ